MAHKTFNILKCLPLLERNFQNAVKIDTSKFISTSCRNFARPDLYDKGYGWQKLPKFYEEKNLRVKANQDAVMHLNREVAVTEGERHRSEYPNWNYAAEIYAFGRRLGEDFEENLLRKALMDVSYSERQQERQMGVGLTQDGSLENNSELANLGLEIMESYVKAYLRTHFPNLPEEGCDQIFDYLKNDLLGGHIARNIGLLDLVLCDAVIPTNRVLTQALHAVVGALVLSQNVQRGQCFVLDLFISQLAEKDLFELMDQATNNYKLLQRIFDSQLNSCLEARLLRSAGSETILSVFTVGIYSDKNPDGLEEKTLVGTGSGETIDIATDMAAKDSLRNFYGLHHGVRLVLGEDAKKLTLNLTDNNWSIAALA